jgi:hypothetical protein
MMVNGVGRGESILAKGVVWMELTIGSKTLVTAFFVSKVQGIYSLILERNWIHANRCVPYSLLQFLIQWVEDEVKIVHTDSSAYVLADAASLGRHDGIACLSGRDLAGFESLEEVLYPLP